MEYIWLWAWFSIIALANMLFLFQHKKMKIFYIYCCAHWKWLRPFQWLPTENRVKFRPITSDDVFMTNCKWRFNKVVVHDVTLTKWPFKVSAKLYFRKSCLTTVTHRLYKSELAYSHAPICTWVKFFRINPEFRILRLTFHRKSASKCWIKEIIIAFWLVFRLSKHN